MSVTPMGQEEPSSTTMDTSDDHDHNVFSTGDDEGMLPQGNSSGIPHPNPDTPPDVENNEVLPKPKRKKKLSSDEEEEKEKEKEKEDDVASKTSEKESGDENDDDSGEESEQEYEVEKILKQRKAKKGGGVEYYIKWVGYEPSFNEWIHESNMDCPDVLSAFKLEEEKKKKKTVTPNKARKQPAASGPRPLRLRSSSSLSSVTPSLASPSKTNLLPPTPSSSSSSSTSSSSTSSSTSTSTTGATKRKTAQDESPTPAKKKKQVPAPAPLPPAAPEKFGVERGLKVKAVLGANRNEASEIFYLVHYEPPTNIDGHMELIPSSLARQFCEEELIIFFESRTKWSNNPRSSK